VIETQDKPTARQEQSKSGGEPEDTREACVQNLGQKWQIATRLQSI
jgi:hypothetical protein